MTARCVQVIQQRPVRKCGRSGYARPGLLGTVLCDEHNAYAVKSLSHLWGLDLRCHYCNRTEADVRTVELRSKIRGPWDGGLSEVGIDCRKYLRGHWRYVKQGGS